jgi:multiple sugar transport system permease protein
VKLREDSVIAWLYLAPAGLVLLVLFFLPVLLSLAVSFTNWEGADTIDLVRFVGGRNYTRTLGDEAFWQALMNTINYVLYSIPPTLVLALAAALLVHRQFRASGLFRTIFFLPYVTTWVSISIVWRYFFDIKAGPLNDVLTHGFGLDPLRWLEEPRGIIEMLATGGIGFKTWPRSPLLAGPSLSMASIIVTTIWRDVGFFMVLFLAGLNNIDPAYYEAARLDGAGPWRRFRRITLPLLMPVTYFTLVVALIGAFRLFVPILVMTPAGGPAKTTSTLVFYLYEKGFVEWKLGLASAVAYIFFLIVFILTAAQNRLLGRRVQYEQ